MKVFVSYAQEDRKIAQQLVGSIESAGAEVLSMRDTKEGADLTSKLSKELRDSDEMIVLLSNKSLDSQWLTFEVGVAAGMGKPITIVSWGAKPDIPFDLRGYRYITYSNLDTYVQNLKERVSAKIKAGRFHSIKNK